MSQNKKKLNIRDEEDEQKRYYRAAAANERRKRFFLTELEKNHGILERACSKCEVAMGTYKWWVRHDEEFRRKALDIMEDSVRYVEEHLMRNIENGDTQAQIFFLKTRGRNFGFSEKVDVSIEGNTPLVAIQNNTLCGLETLDEETQMKIVKAMQDARQKALGVMQDAEIVELPQDTGECVSPDGE